MTEQISLTEDKKAIFLGACQIYAAYIGKGKPEEYEGLSNVAVTDAIKIAKLIDSSLCTEGEICEGREWQGE